jgi:hypothetical protein
MFKAEAAAAAFAPPPGGLKFVFFLDPKMVPFMPGQ